MDEGVGEVGVKSGSEYGEGNKDGKCQQSGRRGAGDWRDSKVEGSQEKMDGGKNLLHG